jgi:hypothetical protein
LIYTIDIYTIKITYFFYNYIIKYSIEYPYVSKRRIFKKNTSYTKKQSLRKKKYNLINYEEKTSISDSKSKILTLKSDLQKKQDLLFNSKQNLDIISKKEIISLNIPKKVNFTNTDFDKLLISEEQKCNLEDTRIKDIIFLKEKEYNSQEQKIKQEFEDKNIILLNKNKNKEKQIQDLNKKIQDLQNELEKEVNIKKLNVRNRFNNRHKSIDIINQYQNQIKLQRNEMRKKQKNISDKEIEFTELINSNLLYKETELNNLNIYIQEQKHKLLTKEISKKEYFTDFKKKNNFYQRNLNKRTNQEIELKNKIQNLKNNLRKKPKVISYNVNVLNNYVSIKSLKKEIKEKLFILYQKKLEKTILQNLLNKNKSKFDTLFLELDIGKLSHLSDLQNKIQDNLNNFSDIKKNINLYKENQVSDNKTKLLNFLNDTVYLLFDKKNTILRKSELELTISNSSNEIKILEKKIYNNSYILEKMEISYEVKSLEREETDNLLTIYELIEIEDFNLKILSL